MANSKTPAATTIPLSSLDGQEFYAVIVQEEKNKKKWNTLWMFCKGCDVAYSCTGKIAEKDDPTMTVDGIKALDRAGRFDKCKELMLEDLFK
jgi:hypothetical protein